MQPQPVLTWESLRFAAMGSTGELLVAGPTDMDLRWVFDRLEEYEQSWSRFRADSELMTLNTSANECSPVSELLHLAIDRAIRAWNATGGTFDPTMLRALQDAGYVNSMQGTHATPIDQRVVARPTCTDHLPAGALSTCHLVTTSATPATVTKPLSTTIDLGGIGKGLAADFIANEAIERGATSCLISMGGDIRIAGSSPEGGWNIPVVDDDGAIFQYVRMQAGALAASSVGTRVWTHNGISQHHLIDPITALPCVSDIRLAVVIAAETWWAEVLAKASVIAGFHGADALLRSHGASGWIVRTNSRHFEPVGMSLADVDDAIDHPTFSRTA